MVILILDVMRYIHNKKKIYIFLIDPAQHVIYLCQAVINNDRYEAHCGIHDIHLRTLSVYGHICIFSKYHELPPTTHMGWW